MTDDSIPIHEHRVGHDLVRWSHASIASISFDRNYDRSLNGMKKEKKKCNRNIKYPFTNPEYTLVDINYIKY